MVNVTLFVFKLVYKNFGKKLVFAPKIDPKICNPKIDPKILDPKKFWIPKEYERYQFCILFFGMPGMA